MFLRLLFMLMCCRSNRRIKLNIFHYYSIVTVIFRYYTVSKHDVGNHNIEKRFMKIRGISHSLKSDHPVYIHCEP